MDKNNQNIRNLLYKKRGALGWREDKLMQPLMRHFEKELKLNPNALEGIEPVHSLDELKALHDKYCIEDATVISESPATEGTAPPASETQNAAGESPASEPAPQGFDNQETERPDPMNRQSPKVRGYVLDQSRMNPDQTTQPTPGGSPNIGEPKSYQEAFKMEDGALPGKDKGSPGSGTSEGGSGGMKPPKKDPPFNPAFDDMGRAKQNKQTRRFAKYITEFVCTLLEYGYVWWTTKDITDVKLMQYELNNEMDLNLMVSLDGVQEQTVKSFFQRQCIEAKKESKISQEDREELSDALADVMMEKGIAPTPTQVLIMTAGKIIAFQGLKAFMQGSQINNLLGQLREMHNGAGPAQQAHEVHDQPRGQGESQDEGQNEYENPGRGRQSHDFMEESEHFSHAPEVSQEIANITG